MDTQPQPVQKWTPDRIAGMSLIIMFLMGLAFILFLQTQESTDVRVNFDNGLDQTIFATYDGTVVATATAHSAIEVWLPVGTHTIRILGEKGDLIEETPVSFVIEKPARVRQWVYNVSTANEYALRFIPFGNAVPPEPQIIGAGQRCFELPNSSPVFAPEGGIPTKGKAGTCMALIIHSKVHPGAKCCESLREFLNPTPKK